MKMLIIKLLRYIAALYIIIYNIAPAKAQCDNIGFENGNFDNWVGYYGYIGGSDYTGIVSGRHTITSGTGYDANTCGLIPVVAPGSTHSVKLGNLGCCEYEELIYTLTVTPQNSLIKYQYAAYQELSNHGLFADATLRIAFRDALDNAVYGSLEWVTPGSGIACGGVQYLPWTSKWVDLSSYVGQTITLEFYNDDCNEGGHSGYSYIDVACGPGFVTECIGSNRVRITAPAGYTHYLWETGDTTANIIVDLTETDYINCTLTSNTGESFTVTMLVQPVMANFTTTTNCNGEIVFTNNSTAVGNDSIVAYVWDFDDNTPYNTTDYNPIHTYPSADGDYAPLLVVTSEQGCSDTLTRILHINYPNFLTASFIVDDTLCGNTVSFTGTSTFPTGGIPQNIWNFGDGNEFTSYANNRTHTYDTAGSYNVSLVVVNSQGCSDTVSQIIDVLPQTIAEFNYDYRICSYEDAVLTDLSVSSGQGINYWLWDFGDGSTSTVENPQHHYSQSGLYWVSLICYEHPLCPDTVKHLIRALPEYIASIQLLPDTVCFLQNSLLVSPSQSLVNVDFGGDTTDIYYTAYGDSIIFRYNYPGIYTINAISSNNEQCRDTISFTAYVVDSSAVVAQFIYQPIALNSFTFINTSTIADQYIWHFGDNNTSTFANPTHTYAQPGTYSVTLIAYNQCNSDTLTRQIIAASDDVGELQPLAPKTIYNQANNSLILSHLSVGRNVINLVDISGKTIYTSTVSTTNTNNMQPIHLPYLAAGLYVVQILSENNLYNTKIFIWN